MFLIPKPKHLPPLLATIQIGRKTLFVYWQDGVVMNLSSLWFQQSDGYLLDTLNGILPILPIHSYTMSLSSGDTKKRADQQSYYELADMMWSDFAGTILHLDYSISANIC